MTTSIADHVQRLVEERQRHVDAVDRIEQTLGQISALLSGGTNGHRKPGRPAKAQSPNSLSPKAPAAADGGAVTLADYLEMVIRKAGKPVSIADLVLGVKVAGYKSKSKDFRPVVSLALIKNKRFKRVGRGVYTVR